MLRKIRKSVFETNSSTSHTLTIEKQIDASNDIGRFINGSMIPSDTTFEFCNSMVQDIPDDYGSTRLHDEVSKLAMCVSMCKALYERKLAQENNRSYYCWEPNYDVEDSDGLTLNDIVKDKPYFKELIQAVKEERNTDLIFVDGVYDLDSLNDDDALESLINDYSCKVGCFDNLVETFKTIIFGYYTIIDNTLPC